MIKFFSSWEKIALDKKLKSFELCKSDGLPVLFLQDPKPAKFRILIAAGFHGNEPAGPVGLNKWAKNLPIDNVAVSFLPLVNPTGFRDGTRDNWKKQPTNRGWIRAEEGETLSLEGRAIQKNLQKILDSSRDGFLTLHEDGSDAFYAYIYAKKKKKAFGQAILSTGKKHFGLYSGYYEPDKVTIKNGLAESIVSSTFEDLIYDSGVPWVCVTETPIKIKEKQRSLAKRAEGTQDLITTFINWVINKK